MLSNALSQPRRITRRRVLWSTGTLVAVPWCSSLVAQHDGNHKADVLVIGAGASGLAAAHELARQDYDVIVLEGRDRIGGRIWSYKPWGDVTLDMGASWIHGTEKNPIAALAKRWKIETVATDDESYQLYRDDGHRYSDNEQDAIEDRLEGLLETLGEERSERQEQGRPDASLGIALDRAIVDGRFSAQKRRELDFAISSAVEQDYAADCNELSLYHWDYDESFDGDEVVFPGGYCQITHRLAEGLAVKLDHVVARIEWDGGRVAASTNHGRFEAECVIVTLPLGVLQRGGVEFSPALPERKQRAIQRLGMGLLNKTFLRFPRRFWPAEADWLGLVSEPRGRWSEFFNIGRFVDQPILLAFTAASFARQLERKSDDETVADVMRALRQMLGKAIPDPTAAKVTRWASDPFSLGSYSFLKVGSTPRDMDELAAPLDHRLYFAGEHTSRDHFATVHGAYSSGLRAAREIMKTH